MVRHAETDAAMRACLIEDEHNLLGWASRRRRATWLVQPQRASCWPLRRGARRCGRGGVDEANQVAPFVALLNGSERALAVKTPDNVSQGASANAGVLRYRHIAARMVS